MILIRSDHKAKLICCITPKKECETGLSFRNPMPFRQYPLRHQNKVAQCKTPATNAAGVLNLCSIKL
jgi:hypothetical protein